MFKISFCSMSQLISLFFISLLDAKHRFLLNVSIIFIRTPPLRLEILGFRAGKRVGLGSRNRSEPALGFGVWVR